MQKLVRFDWAIKNILRQKANFEILEGFLSELLLKDVKILTVLESESNKNQPDDKFNRVDILIQTDEDEKILTEVQCYKQSDFLSRILFGTSKLVTEYIKEGESYKNICKVICVCIVYFDMGEGEDYVYHGKTDFTGRHIHDTLKLSSEEKTFYQKPAIKASDIFPEYHIIRVNGFKEQVQDKLDEWIFFLKNEQIQQNFKAKGIKAASKKLDVLKMDENERKSYERYIENLSNERSVMESSYHKGKEEEKVEIARKMLTTQIDINQISEITGLSIKEIESLK